MRKLALVLIISASAIIRSVAPVPKASPIFRMKGHISRDGPAVTRDGRRIYYLQDSTELFVYDRATQRSAHVLSNMIGTRSDAAVSPSGDRLAFCRRGEDGDGPQLWTVTLDRTTGLPSEAPRRVSLLPATDPSFSPDGKSIAFGARSTRLTENLVIVPVSGGPERVVTQTGGDIWPIRWVGTDSIYMGVSFNDEKDAAKNGIYRVGVMSGVAKQVMRTGDWGTTPGISPDGRFIVAWSPTWDSIVVAAPDGKRLQAYEPRFPDPTPDVWTDATHAVGWRMTTPSVVHVVNFADRKDRVVSDSAASYMNPQWSSDGRQIASLQLGPPNVLLSNAAGGSAQRLGLYWAPGPYASVLLSPDGRSVIYRERGSPGTIHILDVASAKHHPLAPRSTLGPAPQWRSDSRAVLYALVDSLVGADSVRTIEVREITTSGQDRVLHTVKARCSCGKFVDDSLLSTWAGGEYTVTNFRERGAPRRVFTRDGGPQQPVPTFSSDGRWMAVRHQAAGDKWSIELMKPDGSSRKTIPLSFPTAPGGYNPWIRPDGSELIVASNDCARPDSCASGLTFYRVEVATGRSTAIATTPKSNRQDNSYRVSPDGRSLAYVVDLEPYVDFFDFDFSELLKAPGRR